MLFTLLKELIDRFIEFTLRFVKGDSPEAQLTSALKTCVFLISVLLLAMISVVGNNYDLRKEFEDYESSVSKLGFLLNADNLKNSSSEITKLMNSIDINSNIIRKENVRLSGSNIALSTENNMLQIIVGYQLQELDRLRKDNDVFLKMCVYKP